MEQPMTPLALRAAIRDKMIVLIEDNVANQSITKLILESYGARVVVVRWHDNDNLNTVRAAMPVDLILLDLMFPGDLSGFDIYKVLRAEADLERLPIIAVSAMDTSIAVARCREMAFDGFISKPILMATFTTFVAQALSGEEVWEYR